MLSNKNIHIIMGNWCTSSDKKLGAYQDNVPAVRGKLKKLTSDIHSNDDTIDYFDGNFDSDSFSTRSSTIKAARLESFNTLKLVGRGAYGKVYLVEHKETKQVYAMKVLKKWAILDDKGKERVMTERDIIMSVRHPFIVTLHYSFQTDTKLFFILDFLNGGDLYTHIVFHGKFKEKRAKFYTAEIILALSHLHDQGIVYRDLKPQNIIISGDGHVKLTDFGLSKANFEQDQNLTICGTIKYIAPETISGMKYNHTVDWWSLGIILYRMLTGKLPYPSNKNSEVKIFIIQSEIEVSNKHIKNPAARDLISRLLEKDPEKRLGANGVDEIKNHVFFKDINWDDLYNKKIPPPFNPKVKSDRDVKHISQNVLDQDVQSYTIDDNDLKIKNNQMFEDFTYMKGDTLKRAGRETVLKH